MSSAVLYTPSNQVLELHKIGRQFGSNPVVHALTDIDLILKSGDWLSITGPSGAGKSTLLNILGCLDKPSTGSYKIDGIETTKLNDKQRTGLRSRRIGFVFQSFHLLPYRTVLENVMLAEVYRKQPAAGRKKRALDAIKRVGLDHRINYMPTTLSGGERQRVAIARALVGSPSMLLCDEPTGNLDSKNTESVLQLFQKLNKEDGLTIVVVTHDQNVASHGRHLVHIIDGRATTTEIVPQESTSENSELPAFRSDSGNSHTNSNPDEIQKLVNDKLDDTDSIKRTKAPRAEASEILESGMSLSDLFNEALAGMFARPMRMVLTVLGVVIGLTALVATMGLTRTASNRIISQFDQLAATELFVSARPGKTTGIVDPYALPWDAAKRIQRLEGVVAAGTLSEVNVGDALVSSSPIRDPLNQSAYKLAVHAASPDLYRAVRAELYTGRLIDAGHSQRADKVVVLGPDAAERLGINSLRQLPAISLGDHIYLVIGILKDVARKPELLGSVIIPEGTARRHFGLLGPGTVVIETRIGAAYLIARQAPLALRPDNSRLLKVEVPKEPKRVKDEIQTDLNVMFLMLGGLSLVVGAIGIANITLVGVMERTAEIGLRRAIGATRGHIAAQFLIESGSMGVIGGIIGASLGVLIVIGVSAYQVWTPVLDPAAPLLAPLVGCVIGILSGIYPAMRAARMEPVEAFRN